MNSRKASPSGWLPIVAAALLSACAADKLEHPSYWWDGKIVAVERVSEVPSGVDLGCLSPRRAAGGLDDRTVMVVQYRVGKSLVTRAYPDPKADPKADPKGADWFNGERVLVHPDTCRIKPTSRAS